MHFNTLKSFRSWLLIAGFIISSLLATNLTAGVPLDHIVAVVNDDVVMASELAEKVRTIRNQMEAKHVTLPPANILEKQVLENIILTKLQLQFAKNTGIQVDDETLNKTISNIAAENNVNLTQFRKILEHDGYNYEKFREDIRDQITIARLKQRQVDNRVTVTDREIDTFLENEEIQGGAETEYRLSHILIEVPENATEEETEQARLVASKVLEDLSNGADFAKLAKEVSDGQQAENGGDLGWRKIEAIPTLFASLVINLKEGEVSDLIKSPSGFHIIKLTGLRNGGETHMVKQTHARHILLRPNELLSDEDARNRLQQLKLRIEGGDDFAELAKSHSEDTASAVNGGDLGWINPGDMVPEFQEQMDKLKPGEISEPFKSPFGWHIVQVLERRDYDNTEAQKRAKAREIIRKRKINEAEQNWLRSLRDEAYVEYRLDDN